MRLPKILLAAILLMQVNLAYCADEAKIEREAKQIFGSVMSPFCPGRLLNDCPSSSAHELKEKIKAKLRNGAPAAQVEEELYNIYGEELRAAPKFSEFGMAAWLAPPGILLLGVVLVFWWLRRTKGTSIEAKTSDIDPEMLERIDREIQ